MFRCTLALILLLVPAPAAAGVGGEIAYSLRGGREIYLINPDGTGKRLVYRAPGRKTVLGLDMRSNGGELSFEEVDAGGQTGRLKTITYGESGLGTVVREIIGCRFNSDTAPDGSLLFVDSCDGILKRIPPGGAAETVGVPGEVAKVSWLHDGSFLYASASGISRATLGAPAAGTVLAAQDCVQTLNSAHEANEALVGVGDFCDRAIKRLDVAAPSLSASIADGYYPAYSPDDQCFAYLTPAARNPTLVIRRVDGTGTPIQLRKANYASIDWRGDSSNPACPVAASSPFDFRTP
jgi:hypothetical protein